ncbi:Sugar or nucleoside kinase, ribokinase family [Tessaracoccus bendigoensis DSM 12906]|uniref:Sugar or nucleoside kinase, ribokinase family n=1 Tax=Tessaracoccus bendigoensis DSM 12906 TaxID=1123357 RepID=A0A1M6JT40_9ACTN|nr:carbohydrate kinase family protein [Tessaracoccus bendigoensis]SHJ49843.1 Sugar or nucleoside kinase, ribokinase family [Tessaracoccus bendigoensis DSM 12906]
MLGVIGDVVQDVVVWQLEQIRHATDTKSEVRMQRGGSAANVAAFAAPRYPTRFIGCIGDDLGGVVLTTELKQHGVDVRMQVRDVTGMIVVLIDQDGERLMFPSRGASARLETIDPAWFDGLELLHITAYSFETGSSTSDAVREAVREAKRRGIKVSLDVSSTGMIDHFGIPAFLDLMDQCHLDFISANRDESLYLGLADGQNPGPNLARFGDAVLLARQGKDSTNIFKAGRFHATVPVAPVDDVRDLTGAGDAFNAGFLTSYLSGDGDLVSNCLAGHALSARVLSCPGASEPKLNSAEKTDTQKEARA